MSEMDTRSEGGAGDDVVPLSFEAWAELSARLVKLSPEQRLEILDEHEVETEEWRRCEMRYALALADDIEEGRMERVTFYADTCVAEMGRRRMASEAAAVVASAPVETDTEVDPAPELERARGPETGLPSFLHERIASPVAVGPVQRPPAHLAGTAMAFELPTALRPKAADALPFQAGASPGVATAILEPKHPPAPSPPAGATLGVGSDLLAQARSTLPFGKSAGPPPVAYPRMPMQTYASFVAELAESPEKTAEILHKYRVSGDAARAALEQEWGARLEAHADTRAELETMVATYRDWIRQRGSEK
jgi:hypothetical protein